MPKNVPLRAKTKVIDPQKMPGKAPKTVKTVQGDGQRAAGDERKAHSRVFLSEQAVKDKKIIAAVPKPPATVLTSKPAPGMYKGKIVQSKIGSIWKSSSTVQPAQTRSKSVLNRPAHMSKPSVANCPPSGSFSAHPPARTVPATQTSIGYSKTNVVFPKKSGTMRTKSEIPATDKRVNKPVTSTLSQYRFTKETAEEKR